MGTTNTMGTMVLRSAFIVTIVAIARIVTRRRRRRPGQAPLTAFR